MRSSFLSDSICPVILAVVMSGITRAEVTSESLEFRRQATQRMIFDRAQEIPLAGLHPAKVVELDLMHPPVGTTTGDPKIEIHVGNCKSARHKRPGQTAGSVASILSPRMISR